MQITDNDIAPCLIGNTVITTLTNHGYLLYTLNMLKSLKPFGLKQILIVTIDTKSYNILKRMGYNTVCIHNTELSTFCPWNTKGYDKICYYKLELIHQILSLNKNILLIDGDIVFQKDPRPDIEEWGQSDEDIWIQNDSVDDDDTHNMCTGYMFLRSNEKMIELYDDKQKYAKCALDNNDQTFFNEYLEPWDTWIAQNKIDARSACFTSVDQFGCADFALIGVGSKSQLSELLVARQTTVNLDKDFSCPELRLIDPRLWKL